MRPKKACLLAERGLCAPMIAKSRMTEGDALLLCCRKARKSAAGIVLAAAASPLRATDGDVHDTSAAAWDRAALAQLLLLPTA